MPFAPPETSVLPARAASATDCHRVLDQRVFHIARTNNSESTGFQQTDIAAAVQHCRCIFSQSRFQAGRVLGISTAHYPNGACLPALNRLAEEKSPAQQSLQTTLFDNCLAGTKQVGSIGRYEIRGLSLAFTQVAREAFVFSR